MWRQVVAGVVAVVGLVLPAGLPAVAAGGWPMPVGPVGRPMPALNERTLPIGPSDAGAPRFPVAATADRPFAWPLPDPVRVVRGFQAPAEKWLAGHRGVDLAGGPDAPVLAPADGTVTFNGWVVDRQVLVVAHGNLRTTLEPVVGGPPVGTQVAAGNVIGLVAAGQASHCDGCLHWGVRQGATYLDPVALVLPRHRAVLWE